MRTLAGSDASIHFTSLSASSAAALSAVFASPSKPEGSPELESNAGLAGPPGSLKAHAFAAASAHREGILELMKQHKVPLDRVCLLDPKAEKELAPEDGNGAFDWFLFGVRIHLPFSLGRLFVCSRD